MSGAQGARRAPESPAVPGPCLWAGPVRPHGVTTGLLPAQARRAQGGRAAGAASSTLARLRVAVPCHEGVVVCVFVLTGV